MGYWLRSLYDSVIGDADTATPTQRRRHSGASTQRHLAKETGVPPKRISEIIAGQRAITADTDLRLCRFLGLSDGYWLRAQAIYDAEMVQRRVAETV